ncbi:MAG: lytic transglycosylase domain-containing protein, partial [Candidatus Krumholzibacteria bacterium]|nr:lytic transglycosylase domain-containing protein [Candidatus Krumholzibacteria bacterium]
MKITLLRASLATVAAAAAVVGAAGLGAAPATSPLSPAELLARHGEPGRAQALLERAGVEPDVGRMRLEARLLAELGRWAEADSVVAGLVPVGDAHDLFIHHLLRAELNARCARHERALDHLRAIADVAPDGLGAYREYVAIAVHTALGDTAAAVAAGGRGLARGVPEALRTAFDERLIAALAAAGRTERAVAHARAARAATPDLDGQLWLLRVEYDVFVATERFREAAEVAHDIVRRHPRGRDAEAVVRDFQRVVPPRDLRASELLAFAQVLVDRGDTGAAAPLVREARGRRLSAHGRETLRLCEAELHYRGGRYERALELAQPAFSDPGYRRESILISARAERRLDRPRAAARLYEYFARAFPNDVKAAEALYVARSLYERMGDAAGKHRVSSTLRKSYPSTYFGRSTEIEAALSSADAGEFGDAITVLTRRVQRSRRTDEGALYHLASTYRRAGDVETSEMLLAELRRLDVASFYLRPFVSATYARPALRGAGEVEIDGPEGLAVLLARSVQRKEASVTRIAAAIAPAAAEAACAECLARARAFLEAGLRDWGERELDAASARGPSSPGTMLELAGLYDAYAMPWRSVRLYQRAVDATPWKLRRELADDFWWLLYPVPHPVQVLENAARYDLPPHLVYAMIREESRFDALAISRVGAMGLM